MPEIKIKYHDNEIPRFQKIEKGDWIDLCAAETITMLPNTYHLISLGVSMKLPDGYEAHIVPRSSTFKHWGLIQTNGVGIIDNSYSGDHDVWCMPVYATRETTVNKGDRICQFRIVPKMPTVNFAESDHLSDKDRGGFGSTGMR